MSERVRVSIENGVADVCMTRGDKMNALDPAMFDALIEAGRSVGADPSVRAVVLSGEGRCFCAGLDVSNFAAMAGGSGGGGGGGLRGDPFERCDESPANVFQRCAWIWAEVPVPVIAAVHGVAFGGGLQIALGADLRLVSADARLSVMEIQWGLIPDMAISQTLPRVVKLDVAKELTFTGRIVNGAEAVELGLATRVSEDPHADAMSLAREIATRSPEAIRAAKQLFDAVGRMEPAESFLLEEKLQRSLIGSPNQIESVKANLEKRAPKFSDPS
jgi:enoyl-CoA hydratase/carnithine racemase